MSLTTWPAGALRGKGAQPLGVFILALLTLSGTHFGRMGSPALVAFQPWAGWGKHCRNYAGTPPRVRMVDGAVSFLGRVSSSLLPSYVSVEILSWLASLAPPLIVSWDAPCAFCWWPNI